MKYIISISIYIFSCCFIFSVDVKHFNNFYLAQNKNNFIKCPGSFCVSEDNLIFIFDKKDGNIKIYNSKGEHLYTFGRKGMGPDEFVTPFCGNYKKPRIVLFDWGRKSFFFYTRSPEKYLKYEKKVLQLGAILNLHLINDEEILLTGDQQNKKGEWYSISIYNHKINKYKYLLPYAQSYGLSSHAEYLKLEPKKLSLIGSNLYSDFCDGHVYHVWTGDLKIIKLDMESKKIKSIFGHKGERYTMPYVTPERRKAFYSRKPRLFFQAGVGMSFIRYLFTLKSGKVGLIYTNPYNDRIDIFLQIYESSGVFIKEFELLKAKASHYNELYFYFNKENNHLYILDTETSEDFDQFFNMHEYRIRK